MLGNGLGLTDVSVRHGNSVVVPFALPTAVTPKAARGIMLTGYSGPCMTVADGSAVDHDISFALDGAGPRASELAALSGEITVKTVYDTTGNGLHLTQPTLANRPRMIAANAHGTRWEMTCIDLGSAPQYLIDPAVTGLNRRTYARFGVFSPMSSIRTECLWSFNNGATLTESVQTSNTLANGILSNASVDGTLTTGVIPRSQPQVIGVASSATARLFFIRESVTSKTAATSATIAAGGAIGTTSDVPANGGFTGGIFADVLYDLSSQSMSQAQGQAIYDSLATGFSLLTTTTATARVIAPGDSLIFGTSVGQTLQNFTRQLRPLLNGNVEIFNIAVAGRQLTTMAGDTPADAERLLDRPPGLVVVVMNPGTNDIALGARTAANILTDETTYVGKIRTTAPSTIIVTTDLIPRNDASWNGTLEAIRATVNTNRAALSGGADANINYTANAIFDAQADADNTTYYQTDKLHITVAAYAVEATIAAAVINTFLPAGLTTVWQLTDLAVQPTLKYVTDSSHINVTIPSAANVSAWANTGSASSSNLTEATNFPQFTSSSANFFSRPTVVGTTAGNNRLIKTGLIGLIDRIRSGANVNIWRVRLSGDGANRDSGANVPAGGGLHKFSYDTTGGRFQFNGGPIVGSYSFANASSGAFYFMGRMMSSGTGTFGFLVGDDGAGNVAFFNNGAATVSGDAEMAGAWFTGYAPTRLQDAYITGRLFWDQGALVVAQMNSYHPFQGRAPTL
jgi:lysophospholipase L1-like esterase